MTFSRRRGGEYNASVMLETALIPDKSIITAKGDGPAVDLNGATTRVFLLTLTITEVLEQESIEVTIFSSADGQTWSAKPILSFPQKFYRGEHPLLLDLTQQPEIKVLRAHWEVARWGRGETTPMFEFSLRLRDVPSEVLAGARA